MESDEPRPFTVVERVALALFALAPVAFLPGALNRFVFPKVAVAALACALALWAPARGRLPRVVTWLLAAGAVVLLVAALTSASVTGAVFGRTPRYEGVFVLAVYVACAVSGAALLGPGRRRGSMPWWLRWLALAMVAVAIEAILETAGLRPLASDVARPGSLLGNASDEGALGALCLGPLAGAAIMARDWLCAIGAVAAGAVVVLSASRGALVGAVVLAVVLGLVLTVGTSSADEGGRRRGAAIAVIGGLAVLVAGAFALPITRARILGASPLAKTTASGRTALWSETAHMVGSHWWLGVGPSGFVDAIGVEHDKTWQLRYGSAFPPDSPHNIVLQAASAGGVLLMVMALVLGGLVLWRGYEAVAGQPTPGEVGATAGLLAGVAGYGTALMFHLTSPGTTPIAAFCCGILLAQPAATAARARTIARTAAGLLMAVLALVLALAGVAEIPLRSAITQVANAHPLEAEHSFETARALRPWDDEIDATAAHAFLSEATDLPAPLRNRYLHLARQWAGTEVEAYPDSIQALEDASGVDDFLGQLRPAAVLLDRANRLDPVDPQVLVARGSIEGQLRDFPLSIRLIEQAVALSPGDPGPYAVLAIAYRASGRPALARQAEAKSEALARAELARERRR